MGGWLLGLLPTLETLVGVSRVWGKACGNGDDGREERRIVGSVRQGVSATADAAGASRCCSPGVYASVDPFPALSSRSIDSSISLSNRS